MSAPVPPDDGKGVKTIGMILPGILKGIKPRSSGIIFLIEQKWRDIAGRFAGHSRPAKVEKGILTVYVDSSAWLSEMSRFGKRDMLLSLDKSIGKDIVTGLSLVLDPD